MTKLDTEQCVKVLRLLEYVECSPISVAFGKIHYWDFVVDLAAGYEKYGSLTDKQYAALQNLIAKHTDCSTVDKYRIVHEAQYTRQGSTIRGTRTSVEHEYGDLEVIQLYDLPYENGEEVALTVHPYNNHHVVVDINKTKYKIPKPVAMGEVERTYKLKAMYKRTEYKGYLNNIELLGELE